MKPPALTHHDAAGIDANAFAIGFWVTIVTALAAWAVLLTFERTYANKLIQDYERESLMNRLVRDADIVQGVAAVISAGLISGA